VEGLQARPVRQRVLCGLVAAIAIVGGILAFGGPAQAHSGDTIQSLWASVPPAVDGAMSSGEWSAAASVDLGAIPGNQLPAFLLIMNNDSFLWVAYDAVGDTTVTTNDSASFSLDTGHDGAATDGGEDEFYLGDFTAHIVWRGGGYTWEDMPFDPGLPDHAGLAGVRGFGPSDLGGADHRFYEFQIPLVLIGASPGDTLGLFGGSQPAPGVTDYSGYAYSTWPSYVTSPIPLAQYGNLDLAVPPGPIGVVLSPSSATTNGAPGQNVSYNLTARNVGTAVNDTFDVTVTSVWSASLWQAGGTVALSDTDGDAVPDTGNLTSGSTAGIVVKVAIPPSAAGCDVATVTASSSWNLSISDASTLRTCLGPAVFAPPHGDSGWDTNANGRYDYLVVNASLYVSQADLYYVTGDLYSGDGVTPITYTYGYGSFPTGPAVVSLLFDGRQIFASGLNGPYRVNLRLFDRFVTLLDTDVYTTGSYGVDEFEAPPAAFRPPHSDMGVDTDVPPNGFFDELRLNVSLVVETTGDYEIDTSVYDSSGYYVMSSYDWFYLPLGNQSATIVYPGDRFYNAVSDGPYTVQMGLYDQYRTSLDYDVYQTGPYLRSQFDPPPVLFAPPHSDRGVDTDTPPDGLFDWLEVSARVNVSEAGNYTVGAELYAPGGFYIGSTSTTADRPIGIGTMDLRFPGVAIRQAGRTGNFDVFMRVGPAGGGNATTDYDRYTTRYYDYTDFQPPPALFSPPHTDRGVDISDPPDGLYDVLEIDARVAVTRAGPFTVRGVLFGATGVLDIASETAVLPVGAQTVALGFDAHAIRLSGFDGPYRVDLDLYDADGTWLDDSYYYTRPYAYTVFQPPDSTPPTSVSSVVGGYWRNGPVRVDFTASDPTPSDGLDSVALYYRYSPNNLTWFPWTFHDARAVPALGSAHASGSFLFDVPAGEGYYELYTVATDRAGSRELAPAVADVAVGVFVPARLELTPATGTLVAGDVRTYQVRVTNAAGNPVVLESPLTLSLVTDSDGGEFRAMGTSTAIRSIAIPAGGGEVSFDYRDTVAGTTTLTVASPGAAPGSAVVTVGPGAVAALEISPAVGGVAVGSSVTLGATARDAFGNVVPGASVSWSVEGPGSLSSTSGATTSLTATGAGFIRVTATSGGASASVTISGIAGSADAASNLAIGLGGGAVLGLLAGIAIGWVLTRRRKGPEAAAPPPLPATPPPPAEERK